MASFKVVVLVIFLCGCQTQLKKVGPGPGAKLNARQAYFAILKNLDPAFPGRGTDVYNNTRKDRPMAYGLILSAEANRYKNTGSTDALNRLRICGNWLVSHSDLNQNGITGYGLADAWDAFGDSTINPIHEEYTITTAVVVKALLDWVECDPEYSKTKGALQVSVECLKPYLTDAFNSPAGIPAYSLSIHDRKYDVFNPAVYLSGQLQRVALLRLDDSLVNLMKQKSQRIIEVLLKNKLTDEHQNIFWNYGLEQKRPNDLIHMAYIVEGLRDYKKNGGELNLSWEKVIHHTKAFQSGNKWYERVGKEHHNLEENVRLWALGLLVYTLAREEQMQIIDQTLLPQLALYRKPDGRFKFKENDNRSMVRQDAHLLLGLSYYLFHK